MADKLVYNFGDGEADGKGSMKNLLGGKGANLAEMANLGLPVPPGFTIPTSVCTYFYAHEKSYPKELKAQVEKALDHVGKLTGKARIQSIQVKEENLQAHLLSPEFFDAERHPEVTFTSNGELEACTAPEVATRVYPDPGLSTRRSANVATPL